MPSFSLALAGVIPRDDGSHANDWVTDQWEMPEPLVRFDDSPQGPRRAALLDVRFSVYSGSGSNTWTVEPVFVLDPQAPSDARRIWPHVPQASIGVAPVIFTQADLPYQKVFRVPLRMCFYALRLARAGAGTNVLDFTAYALGATSV